jgi:hypothetical protein
MTTLALKVDGDFLVWRAAFAQRAPQLDVRSWDDPALDTRVPLPAGSPASQTYA